MLCMVLGALVLGLKNRWGEICSERHIYSRTNFKLNRATALAELG